MTRSSSAGVGHGATLNGRPIHVSDSTSLDDGLLSIGMSPRIGADEIVPIVDTLLRQGVVYYREGSGALSLAYVAAGRLIGYIESHLNSWDGAAGVAIVQAAGGASTIPDARSRCCRARPSWPPTRPSTRPSRRPCPTHVRRAPARPRSLM